MDDLSPPRPSRIGWEANTPPPPGTDGVQARIALIDALRQMAHGENASTGAGYDGDLEFSAFEGLDETEFLDSIAEILRAYADMEARAKTTTTDMLQELTDWRQFGVLFRRLVSGQQ